MRLLLALLLWLALPAWSLADITFGPTPRALDNRMFLDAEDPLRANEWRAARAAGLTVIDLNPTFLMRSELGRAARGGQLIPRHHGTYLDDTALAHLRARTREGWQINYQAGIGLSADRCALRDPAALGVAAAEAEYTHVISHLHRAGIAVAAISVDGPFLRLLQGSRKAFSCAEGTRDSAGKLLSDGAEGKSLAFTARAVHAYLGRLADLVTARQSRRPEMALTVNLPNWREGDLPSVKWRDLTASASEMLFAFAMVPGSDGHDIRWIRLDYPACYATGAARCGGGTAETLVAKTAGLWRAARRINGTGRPPALAVIANTTGAVAPCVRPNETPKFLPFRNYRDQSIGRSDAPPGPAGFTRPDPACQIAQRDGPDRQFMQSSIAYANSLTRGALARRLRQADPELVVRRIAFQSWGVSPMSNLWYLRQIRRYAEDNR